ncbi:MAG TPA: hypothetical protein VHC21_01975 [Candidatus Saccharimonadales bacterium]|nr:hypothetical protein [Candidatus Saccharimonadales bacterium]
MAREQRFDLYNSGGEHRPLRYEDMVDLLGKMATRENDWGADSGGELAELPRPFHPPDIGSVALRPPTGERILELTYERI